MPNDIRAVKQDVKQQGTAEKIIYTITTGPWQADPSNPGSPTNVSAAATDLSDDSPVTGTLFPTNSPSVAADVITLSPLQAVTAGKTYKIEVTFTVDSNVLLTYFLIRGVA